MNRIALMWALQAQFAGYAVAAVESADVALVSRKPGRSPLQELLEDRAEFATVSPAQAISAGSAAADVAFVVLFMRRSPVVLVGLASRAGDELGALDRMRVGIWPGEDLEIRAMLRAAGVGPERVELVAVDEGFDEFLDGRLDLLQATTYNELPALRERAPDAHDLVVHEPSRWDVDCAKDGLVVRRELLAAEPERVDRVVAAAITGWRRAIEEPDVALAALKVLVPDLDEGSQREQLKRVVGLIDVDDELGRPAEEEIDRAARVHEFVGADVQARPVVDLGPWERAAHG